MLEATMTMTRPNAKPVENDRMVEVSAMRFVVVRIGKGWQEVGRFEQLFFCVLETGRKGKLFCASDAAAKTLTLVGKRCMLYVSLEKRLCPVYRVVKHDKSVQYRQDMGLYIPDEKEAVVVYI